MALPKELPLYIVGSLIIIFGIIHLGVGIGITAGYSKYSDVTRQSVGLSIFNIIIGLYAMAVGILSLVAVTIKLYHIVRPAAICSLVLGIVALASLIAALALNSQAIGYVRSRLSYRLYSYASIDGSQGVMDTIQTNYHCCGENLWLDWATVSLSVPTVPVVTSGSSNKRRRRSNHEQSYAEQSPLLQGVRQRRQATTVNSGSYNLPSGYSINLPYSCCKTGGIGNSGNSIGGTCVYSSSNNTNSFYVGGCLAPVSNDVVVQITGIAVINVVLTILAFVFVPILSSWHTTNNLDGKQTADGTNGQPQPQEQQEQQQQQQQPQQMQQNQNGGYYMNNTYPNAYYSYPAPTNNMVSYAAPTNNMISYAAPMNNAMTYSYQ
ncbi:unnamed protein product [Adineta steineri]|uniref:Tetraspanin n=1 Tax=Adineta steineri TaxID=433720 RepID=A0A819XVS6_9BILA|nr:unnamed protein product [Adineta steineri]